MKLIRELLFCYILRAFTNSSEVKYNVQRKLLFFFLFIDCPRQVFSMIERKVHLLPDLLLSCLALDQKQEKHYPLLPNAIKDDRVKILPLSQL